ncbi:DUF2075 domain-containing protein [Enterococcus sp. LJL90]
MENELIIEEHTFTKGELAKISTTFIAGYPIVYILYNRNSKKRPVAYIGQTVQVDKRMNQHLKDKRRKTITNTVFIGHERFNQSATYNIETNLINHFIGDEKFILQNVSQTRKTQSHRYYDKDFYDEIIFSRLWNELKNLGLVNNSIDAIHNKDIFKVSPYKELSAEQMEIKQEILDYCLHNIGAEDEKIFMIEGDAGTGKSVVLASLYNTIQDLSKTDSALQGTNNYLLVNHSEMLKTYHSMAEGLPNLKKKNIIKPTQFINLMDKKNEKADIVVVDEAHLLLTMKDAYNSFKYENQLDEIVKRAKITIFIYDSRQVLRTKSYGHDLLMDKYRKQPNSKYFRLNNQFRMMSSEETLLWIDDFVNRRLGPLPDSTEDFTFKIAATPEELKSEIVKLNKDFGLSRILSTFDYLHKKDDEIYYVDPDGVNLPWNTTNSKITWAERTETINEVGSIYTAQGFDFNNVGLILGPSIDYDEELNELVIIPENYKDTGGFIGRKDMNSDELLKAKEQIILNSINTLMKRAIHGLYIYPVNPKLRKKLLELQNRN